MAGAAIDAVISATSQHSPHVSGAELSNRGSVNHDRQCTIQIIPRAAGNFTVQLEAAANTGADRSFNDIGEWDQDEDTLVSIVPISENVLYRFKHISGAACRVVLTR